MRLILVGLLAACFPSCASIIEGEQNLRRHEIRGQLKGIHHHNNDNDQSGPPARRNLHHQSHKDTTDNVSQGQQQKQRQQQQPSYKVQSPAARRRRRNTARHLQDDNKSRIGAFDNEDETPEQAIDWDFTGEMKFLFEEETTNPPTTALNIINSDDDDKEGTEEDGNTTLSNGITTTVNDDGLSGSGTYLHPTEETPLPSTAAPSSVTPILLAAPPREQVATTVAPSITPVVVLSASEKAQEAGTAIVQGVTDNLQQGGSKDASSSTATSTSTSSGGKSQTGDANASTGGSGSGETSTTTTTVVTETTTTTTTNVLAANEAGFASGSKSIKGSKKSKQGAFGVSGVAAKSKGKKGKKGKKGAKGVAGVAGATAVSGGGKGGKGGKYGAASGTGTVVNPGVSAPTAQVAAPAPTPFVSGAIESPSTPAPVISTSTSTAPAPQQSQETADNSVRVDCQAIAAGTANTTAPKQQSFNIQANWLLEDSASIENVAADVQVFLQSQVAPAIAGCADTNNRRQRERRQQDRQFIDPQPLITNVVFDKPTSDGNCTTDQPNVKCYTTDGATEVYYYGVDTGVGERLLNYLQAAGVYPVPGLLGVVNLSVFDAAGNQVGRASGNTGSPTGIGNGNEVPSGNGNTGGQSTGNTVASATTDREATDNGDDGMSQWSKTLIGVSAATAFLGFIICVVVYCLYRRRENQVDHADFNSLPAEQAIPRVVGKGATSSAVFLDDAFSNTWPDANDEDSSSSEEEIGDDGETAEIIMDARGQTHVCASAYCEVCAQNTERIKFVSSDGGFGETEELPNDATRDYYVNDTVAL